MIVQMKKLTLLCVAHDRAATLKELRELGVLHVTPVTSPASTGLEDAREKAAGLQRLLEAVPVSTEMPPTGRDLATVIADVSDLLDQRKEWQERLEFLKTELERTAPFGAFDPAAIRALAKKGVVLKLYRAPVKSVLPLPAGVTARKVDVRKADAYWALFANQPFDWAGAEEQKLPEGATEQLQYEAERLDVGLAGIAEELKRTAGDRALLERAVAAAAADVKFQEVRAGMGGGSSRSTPSLRCRRRRRSTAGACSSKSPARRTTCRSSCASPGGPSPSRRFSTASTSCPAMPRRT